MLVGLLGVSLLPGRQGSKGGADILCLSRSEGAGGQLGERGREGEREGGREGRWRKAKRDGER